MHNTAISEKLYFNSIKVQLERINPNLAIAQMKFQFHKGTIRTGV